jgi:eukaryotic-like serine/threonine-protein kinase
LHRAQQLGRYHLLDRIAFGGMAEIFRAKTFDDSGHAHLVAVKRILSHLSVDEDFIQMLVDEAKIASLLRHDNIAQVYELARAHDEYYIAMEFVDGKDVRSIIEKHRTAGRSMHPTHAAYIAAQIATALAAAHDVRDAAGRPLDLVHRDVSPSNIICSYAGETKLCDFGIAKATVSRTKTKTGIIKGKVKYMSPEQAMGRRLDRRSDLFSLGAVLYEMLTRTPPYQAPNEMELILKVRDARTTPIADIEPSVPAELVSIVGRALARSRDERYQSGDDMAAALRRFLARHAPNYTRSTLGRFLRRLFEPEIERELRILEDYVVGAPDADVGVNLLADALGPAAPYTLFSPEPPSQTLSAPTPVEVDTGARTRLVKRRRP